MFGLKNGNNNSQTLSVLENVIASLADLAASVDWSSCTYTVGWLTLASADKLDLEDH